MKVPFLNFEARNTVVREKTLKKFEEFFDSKWYVHGSNTTQFETDYANFNDVKHCIGVSTGLDALHLSLLALGIGEGDEVIVPSNTYIATVLAITYVRAVPVFVEPRRSTFNLNPDLIESAITGKTKAIMPVHLYGQCCEMDQIMQIANKHNLFVVEDNAQSQGATYNGKLTGSFGHVNGTSFYPTKNIGALGEAGAITTDNPFLDGKLRTLRNYGSQKRYYNEVKGFNNRIDEFEAAYLTIALEHIADWTKERQELAELYTQNLKGIEQIEIPEIIKNATHVYHIYAIKCRKRNKLKEYLRIEGVDTVIHYPIPPHLQECYNDLGYSKGDFPIAEELADEQISLPLYPGLSSSEVSYVCDKIKYFYDI